MRRHHATPQQDNEPEEGGARDCRVQTYQEAPLIPRHHAVPSRSLRGRPGNWHPGRPRDVALVVVGSVLAAAALAAGIALTIAGTTLLILYVLLRYLIPAGVRRVPLKWVLWAGVPGGTLLGRALPDSWIGIGWLPEIAAGGAITAACLAGLWWLRRRQRRQFRETGGRAFNPRPPRLPRQKLPRIAAENQARLDDVDRRRAQLEEWKLWVDTTVTALVKVMTSAFEAEGLPLPAEFRALPAEFWAEAPTAPLPRLRLVASDGRRIGA